jgi:lysyl oxidase-like protein 2/3/4
MEENCLASEAYRIRHKNPDFSLETRRLLRFTTSIENIGNADFRPHIPKSHWVWHGCHQHYHSMEIFAHYEIMDHYGVRVSEGQKASFCLEDNDCDAEVSAVYDCENYGDQGITPGCKDIYHANIDCQWLDVTELPTGVYTFKLSINPEFKVAEQTFENNAALCTLQYTQQYALINNCTYTRP